MRIPPEGIEVGDTLTQDEIEDAYNTGFGYRISGINPRRDDHDRRYILLFANEDGPYSDSVTQGRFEYIGEGLSGDQSEDSPGNSALIDARTADIPIHFFYKRADGEDWEYQGLVEVVNYESVQRGGREVLVFTMEHRHQLSEKVSIENENSQLNKRPDIGETITAKIDRISSGNGIIEFEDGPINIGPVVEGAVGEEITAKIVGNIYAVCKTSNVLPEDYWREYGWLVDPDGDGPKIDPDLENSHFYSQSKGNDNKTQSPDQVDLDDVPIGDTFTAEIDRISDSGNGIIETKNSHINIGPVTQEAVGTEVTAKMDSDTFARCITEEVRAGNYEFQYRRLRPSASHISESTFCDKCGSLMYPSGDEARACSSCGYKESGITTDEDETEIDSDTTDESSEKQNDSVPVEEDSSTKPSETPKNRSASEQTETTLSDPDSSTDTSELRKRAVESAVEEVPEEASTVQHETPTYNRSQAVKEYVKARAGGVCEGCGEPAPFTSKTGEPYLHAHHIHELSDGGSDTPDTVVALCPNCHYRVHHGEDGDEYNQELLEVVQEKENSNE